MTGKDLLTELGKISTRYYDEAENETIPRKGLRRPFLIAAVIAMTLLLTGCAVVYMLKMQDMKVGDQEVTTPVFNEYLEFQGNATIPQQVLSLAGVKGTPSYQAAQEWFEFKQNYDPDYKIMDSVWGNEPEFPEQYAAYGPYSQEMVDKLDEIAAKYGLKLQGHQVTLHGGRRFYEEMGIDDILMPDSRAKANIVHAYCYENGSWGSTLFTMTMPEEEGQWPYSMVNCLYYNKKDCFSTDLVALDDTGDWTEWNHTTASGQDVLLLMSPSDYAGWIICDREDAMIAVRVSVQNDVGYNEEGKTWFDTTYMSNKQFEQVADAIDFNIKTEYQGEAVSTADPSSHAQTYNGYTITVKSVETDGYSANILLGITAPEGTKLIKHDRYSLCNGNWGSDDFTPANGKTAWGSMSCMTVDDGDGLDNTADLLIDAQHRFEDGSLPFTADSVWNLYFEDLVGSWWDDETCQQKEEVLAEGAWNFDLHFEEGDFREIELIREPVTAQVCKGWNPKTGDIYEDVEITSFKLRSLSATITHNGGNARLEGRNGQNMCIVMKDGSQIALFGGSGDLYTFNPSIDVNQVDYVLLTNGTKLPASAE